MSRRFRLAALERLRDARLDEAERALALARRAFADAGAARDAAAARLAAARFPDRATGDEAVLTGLHRAYLRNRLSAADAAVADAARGVDGALAAWRSARTDVRAVRSLHDRYRATLAAADARHEQLILDDLAATAARRETLTGSIR